MNDTTILSSHVQKITDFVKMRPLLQKHEWKLELIKHTQADKNRYHCGYVTPHRRHMANKTTKRSGLTSAH